MISASATTRLTQASQRGSEAVVACLLVVGADLARIEIAALAACRGHCRRRRVPAHDVLAYTARRRPRPGGSARTLHGRYEPVLVARLALAPTLAAPLMSVSPPATMLAAAAVAAGAALAALGLESRLPAPTRLPPAACAAGGRESRRRRADRHRGAMSTKQVAGRPVETRTDAAALLAGMVAVTLWGSAFVAIRDVGKSMSPGSVALGRLLVSLVVLGVAAAIWREPLPRRDLLLTQPSAQLFLGVYSFTLNEAERLVDAGTAAMLINTGPILIAVWPGSSSRRASRAGSSPAAGSRSPESS